MTQSFSKLLQSARQELTYYVTGSIIEFTESVAKKMSELGINRAELAERIDSSPQYITKILRGNANFTIQSMTKLARALDSDLQVRLVNHKKYNWQTLDETEPSHVQKNAVIRFAKVTGPVAPENLLVSRSESCQTASAKNKRSPAALIKNEPFSTAA